MGKLFVLMCLDIYVDFFLCGFVVCGDCDYFMIVNWIKGCNGCYLYYVCCYCGCDYFGKFVKWDMVEGVFEVMLMKLMLCFELFSFFLKIFCKCWNEVEVKVYEGCVVIKCEMVIIEKKIG